MRVLPLRYRVQTGGVNGKKCQATGSKDKVEQGTEPCSERWCLRCTPTAPPRACSPRSASALFLLFLFSHPHLLWLKLFAESFHLSFSLLLLFQVLLEQLNGLAVSHLLRQTDESLVRSNLITFHLERGLGIENVQN